MKRKSWLLLLVSAVLLNIGSAMADDGFYVVAMGGGVGTKITRSPYTISSPGFYYLGGNLTHSSDTPPAITVTADDVTIDLMGFSISGNANNNGIYLNGPKNVEIRNGTLRNFSYAILFETGDHRVINVRVRGTINGIALGGSMVKGCTFTDNTNISIFLAGGIVTGNVISKSFTGISTYAGTVSGNSISNCPIGISGKGIINGNTIINSTGAGIDVAGTISGNWVDGCLVGIDGSGSVVGNTVFCQSGQTGIKLAQAAYSPSMMDQNTVSGNGTHYAGGSDATVWGTNAGR